jgi:hypothetical protein
MRNRNVGDRFPQVTSKYPEYPLMYLYGDGRAVESAAIDRRGRALAEERRFRGVEVEHRRRRIERVPACGTACIEPEPCSGRVRNPTYIAVTSLRSCFAALTAAALVASLEAWCMS